jgi:threonyl-tRNA synthetase
MSYIDSDGKPKRPYMIHRALLGSIERFFGVLIEHYAGNFPVWLAPVQARVLPITDDLNEYATDVMNRLKRSTIRAQLDDRSEKVSAKIRDAELEKIPYMLIVGKREAETDSVSIRKHLVGDLGVKKIDAAIDMITDEADNKRSLMESEDKHK